jgi:c-di-GMP-binding flagellar brake protein YcgR
MRCFSAAVGFMTRERRRYFRHPVEISATVVFGQGKELKTATSNISEGGMAIRCRGELPKGGIVKIVFTLPGSDISMEPKAEVAWADGAGRAGIRFTEMPDSSRQQLDHWLTEQMEKAK